MEQHLPAPREDRTIQPATGQPIPAEEPAEPEPDFSVVLLPIAIVVFLVLTFIAAAWTLLASVSR